MSIKIMTCLPYIDAVVANGCCIMILISSSGVISVNGTAYRFCAQGCGICILYSVTASTPMHTKPDVCQAVLSWSNALLHAPLG
jgi:aspartate 1-decarboxylase